jgi:hypothetical protein
MTSELTLSLYKTAGFSQKLVGTFACNFKNALDLLDGSVLTLELDKFTSAEGGQGSSMDHSVQILARPVLVVTMSYLNSLFTRSSKGKLAIKIKSVSSLINSKSYL